MKFFSLLVDTLDWKGAKNIVAKDGTRSKLALSVMVMWFSDGTMDLVVLWRDNNRDDKDRNFTWTEHNGIWWLEHTSSFTTLETFPEVIRFFLRQGPHGRKVDLLTDDSHGGHYGSNVDNMLKELNPSVSRVRVQGRCTDEAQAADRPRTNGTLQFMAVEVVHKLNVRACLQKEYTAYKTLTVKAREFFSTALSEIKRRFGEEDLFEQDLQDGIIQSFRETGNIPFHEKHSELRKTLEVVASENLVPIYNPKPTHGDSKKVRVAPV